MPLCPFCVSLTVFIFDHAYTHGFGKKEKDIPFAQSAASCTLCEQIVQALPDASWAQVPLYTDTFREYSGLQADDPSERIGLCSLELLIWRKGKGPGERVWPNERVCFAIWADPGSVASQHCVTRSPIVTPDTQSFCSLTKTWLGECDRFHAGCKSDDGIFTLPTRVLKLTRREHGAAPSIRLVEANGLQARYCALSHCWGKSLPLMTTRANFAQHKSDIPIVSLPKTFREAIMLALGVGLEYIWIDSLCIIQGDIEDWEKESDNMGAVYRYASFVIAAAASQDSSGGLQPSRPSFIKISLPCVIRDATEGLFNIALMPGGKLSPKTNPLGDRAWALQEWYLASRILFCLSSGLAWKCRGLEVLEPGNMVRLMDEETMSWSTLLECYTAKKLTVSTDRLHALRGIVAQMQESSSDRFLYDLGVWETEDADIAKLAAQLLWRRQKRDDDTLSIPLPTWSWAATGWEKIWCQTFEAKVESFHVPDKLEIQSSGTLKCVGKLVDFKIASRRVPEHVFDGLDELHHVMHLKADVAVSAPYEGHPAYRIHNRSQNAENLGIVMFDTGYVDDMRCFPLLAIGRHPGKSWFPKSRAQLCQPTDDGLNTSFAETSLNEPRLSRNHANDHVEIDFSSDGYDIPMEEVYRLERTTEYVYFGIVLRPTVEGRFERGGVAFLYPCALDQGRAQHAEFEIV